MKLSCDMGLAFEKWQKLTDEYAQALTALQRGELGARSRVNRLAREILNLPSQAPETSGRSGWHSPSSPRNEPR